jgi:D-glycero-D-manno-heptose 1,7-bisphosphate phosphatase
MQNKFALFLDRDGTVNVDMGPGYLNDPTGTKLIGGAGRAIVRAKNAGFAIAIITNQAGVAKGITKEESLPLIHRRLEELIAAEAGVPEFKFDDIRICMHHPDEKCGCRKPETEMLEASIKKLGVDPARSFFVGDKVSDIVCGQRLGMRTILVLTGHGMESQAELREPGLAQPTAVVASITEAVEHAIQWIKKS